MNQQLLALINDNYSQVKRFIRQQLDSKLKRRVSESDIFQESCLRAKRSSKKAMSFDFFLKLIRGVSRQRKLKHLDADDGSLRHERNASHIDKPVDDSSTDRFEKSDTAIRVERLIGRMSEKHREILSLVHLRRMTIVQASSYIGISSEAAKKRYQRAIARMRELTSHLKD
ncbi:MAG: sigma-70 family RNA polymerase sigma factor [Planctomycetota bacterium]